MDLIKINGASYLQGGSSPERPADLATQRIILTDDVPVYRFIDSAGFDGNCIQKVRVARELLFDFDAWLKLKPAGEVLLKSKCLSGLLEVLEETRLPDYRLVLDTTDKEALSEIIQQLLYLDIDMEVMLKGEEAEVRKMELFMAVAGDLETELDNARKRAHALGARNALKDYRNNILYVLSDIEANIRGMHERDLKVAVMALKKSGKSVVVNCLLGNEYTPASIELPTFTTTIYRKSRDGVISLDYKNSRMVFETAEGLKDYVLKEFRHMNAEKSTAYIPEDMEVSYVPAKDMPCNYTVIDTPGPDLAGSFHKEIAYKWIREADVILFIIDYSKHLTSSEEEFFADIKRVFEEYQKFYSFIVVVNKLDLMYLSEEKKSGLRFLDFLRSRLKDMGYRGLIVLGTSALQYFYSQKAAQIEGCEDILTADGKQLRECLDRCLARYQGRDEMTVFSFLDNQVRGQLWFHGKEEATLEDLREKSGIGKLMKYINYISMEKVHIEAFNHRMALVDRKVAEFRDGFIGGQILLLEKDNLELEGMTEAFGLFSGEMLTALDREFLMEDMLDKIGRDISLAQKSLGKVLNMHIEDICNQLAKTLKSLPGSDLVSFQKGGRPKAVEEMSRRAEKGVVEKLYAPVLGKYCSSLNKEIAGRNKRLGEYTKMIQEKIAGLNAHLKKAYGLKYSEIVLPKLPDSFTGFDFSPITMALEHSFINALITERLVRKRGFMGVLLLLISFGFINSRTGGFKFDDVKLKKALYLVRKSLEDSTQKQISAMHGRLFTHINLYLDKSAKDLSETAVEFLDNCKAVFDGLLNDLVMLKNENEMKGGFLREAGSDLGRFSSIWNRIKDEG